MKRYLLAVCILVRTSPAIAADVDWKWYGGLASAIKGEEYCFYEERGLVRAGQNIIRVWTKCLLQRDLDAVSQKDIYWRAFIDMSASRIAHYYFPPIAKIEHLDSQQIEQIIAYETLADVSGISPDTQIFYELDCGQRKLRELHISVGTQSTDVPTDWKNVPPEGNGANLISLLCH